jgi:hypothetical protein
MAFSDFRRILTLQPTTTVAVLKSEVVGLGPGQSAVLKIDLNAIVVVNILDSTCIICKFQINLPGLQKGFCRLINMFYLTH